MGEIIKKIRMVMNILFIIAAMVWCCGTTANMR